ncbi:MULTISPECIES: phage tail tape measure protein [unclassified Clostridium]|uniref:phage tail tape measure protein n=1 Tax=unclassified Clostridium TaxID=2614128 RepID=UPI0002975315|nr:MULTISPECIES: phage tail tape measure protein [unclassified Clostridium]EKQ51394.1 MAG: phage tail tape measure protein, TP901 family [Clostridium sp. Maddingley MBC34-26]
MASKVIDTILNLRDNFSDTIKNVAQNTQSFKGGMQQTENQAISMKKTVSDAFSTIKESMLHGIGFGAGMDIWESMKDSIVETVTFGNELQKSLNGVMASSGLAETGMDRMKNIMLDIYNDNFGENFDDIGESLKEVGQQTGYTGDDLKGLTENAIALRDTFGYDVGESVRSASMLMKQFGINGDEAFNLISQGKQSGLDFSGEMLDSIDEYSVQFKKLGLNAEDMFNVFSAGSQEGAFNLDKVGDAVKEFSIRAVDGSKTTQDGFTQLGFNADDLAAKFALGGDSAKNSFEDVITALANIKDPLKQSQIGVELFGTQFEDLGINVIESLGNVDGEISNTYDALAQINKIKYSDVGSAFEGIKRNIQTSVLIPISDAVLPRLNDFANWFKDEIPSIKQTISSVTDNFLSVASNIIDTDLPAVQNLGSSISDLATTVWNSVQPAFDSVKPDNWNSVADAIKDIIDKATDTVNYINDNWTEIEPIIITIVGALGSYKLALMAIETWTVIVGATTSIYETIELVIWGVVNATSAWEAIQWALNVAMDANPIGVVITVIGLLGLAIYELVTHWQDIWNWIKSVWDVIDNNPILKFISFAINPLGTAIMECITHWDDITNAIKGAWDWLTSWLDKWNNTTLEDKTVNINENVSNTDTSNADQVPFNPWQYKATGTPYSSGGLTVAGEYGPELIDLPGGSKVYTNSQTNKILNGSGNSGIHVYLTVQGNMVGNEEFADQVGQHIYNQIQLGMVNV